VYGGIDNVIPGMHLDDHCLILDPFSQMKLFKDQIKLGG
jgi:hypothetical protein